MEIHSENIDGGILTVYENGDYSFLAGDPENPDSEITYYSSGYGPYQYRLIAARVFELYTVTSGTTASREPITGRSEEDELGVPPSMRSGPSRVRSDRRLRDARTREDELRLRELTQEGNRLGVSLGRLHARLRYLIQTGGRGYTEFVAGDFVLGASREIIIRVPSELESAIISGLIIEDSSGGLMIADIRRGIDNDLTTLGRELPGFAIAYDLSYFQEESQITHELLEEIVLTVVDIVTEIITFGGPIILRALRQEYNAAHSSLVALRRERDAVLSGEIVDEIPEGAIYAGTRRPSRESRRLPAESRRLPAGTETSSPIDDASRAVTDESRGISTPEPETPPSGAGVESVPHDDLAVGTEPSAADTPNTPSQETVSTPESETGSATYFGADSDSGGSLVGPETWNRGHTHRGLMIEIMAIFRRLEPMYDDIIELPANFLAFDAVAGGVRTTRIEVRRGVMTEIIEIEGGTAFSLKSANLLEPGYNTARGVRNNLRGYVGDIFDFPSRGHRWSQRFGDRAYQVFLHAPETRILHVEVNVVPTPEQISGFQLLAGDCHEAHVLLQIFGPEGQIHL